VAVRSPATRALVGRRQNRRNRDKRLDANELNPYPCTVPAGSVHSTDPNADSSTDRRVSPAPSHVPLAPGCLVVNQPMRMPYERNQRRHIRSAARSFPRCHRRHLASCVLEPSRVGPLITAWQYASAGAVVYVPGNDTFVQFPASDDAVLTLVGAATFEFHWPAVCAEAEIPWAGWPDAPLALRPGPVAQ
jgi:hypothetical protein